MRSRRPGHCVYLTRDISTHDWANDQVLPELLFVDAIIAHILAVVVVTYAARKGIELFYRWFDLSYMVHKSGTCSSNARR